VDVVHIHHGKSSNTLASTLCRPDPIRGKRGTRRQLFSEGFYTELSDGW
jgi:hypothetical protein